MAAGGYSAPTFKNQPPILLFNVANHHTAIEVLAVENPKNPRVVAALVALSLLNNFDGFGFGRTANGASGKHGKNQITQILLPIGSQGSRYF